jgi:hypothetical protein
MEKIIAKLQVLETELENLKKVYYKEGEERYYEIKKLVERIIYRIYPDKDANRLVKSLNNWGATLAGADDSFYQEEFVRNLNKFQRFIRTIKEEYELFGFDDFKPIKEKVETEMGVKAGIFKMSRKKTKEDK